MKRISLLLSFVAIITIISWTVFRSETELKNVNNSKLAEILIATNTKTAAAEIDTASESIQGTNVEQVDKSHPDDNSEEDFITEEDLLARISNWQYEHGYHLDKAIVAYFTNSD